MLLAIGPVRCPFMHLVTPTSEVSYSLRGDAVIVAQSAQHSVYVQASDSAQVAGITALCAFLSLLRERGRASKSDWTGPRDSYPHVFMAIHIFIWMSSWKTVSGHFPTAKTDRGILNLHGGIRR